MHSHARHTIHRNHIHHGWNNAFKPVLTVAPGDTIHFETRDASSGQLSKTSTAEDLKKLGPNVNLGNIPPTDLMTLESFRRGLKEHTLLHIWEMTRDLAQQDKTNIEAPRPAIALVG